ncbi:MAG: hypothetical protein AAF693_21410 [Bacteroidota bacterium]
MKALNFTFLTLITSLFIGEALAQFNPYTEKAVLGSAGIGISGYGIPIYASIDFGIADNITVGGGIGYQRDTESFSAIGTTTKWRHSIFSITARGSYHFNEALSLDDTWDIYGGLDLGYYIWDTKLTEGSTNVSYSGSGAGGLGVALRAGARYFFKKNLAGNLEVGGGNVLSSARIGITLML